VAGLRKQLRGDLAVGGALAGHAGDQCFLRSQGLAGSHSAGADGVPAGRAQLDLRPSSESRGADRVEGLVRAAQLIAGVTDVPVTAQPLAVRAGGRARVPPAAGSGRGG